MPVFNEEGSVTEVVGEWFDAVARVTNSFTFLAIDDGSTDSTPAVLAALQAVHGPRLEVYRRANRGHGQSCIEGYIAACERGIPFVFQMDSDGQCDPQYFERFWRARHDFDVLYGKRVRRDDGLVRSVGTRIVTVLVRAVTGVDCVDPNVPYRLMQTRAVAPYLGRVPVDFVLAHVALAVVLRRAPALRHGAIPIRFRRRSGGTPSVPSMRFGHKAIELARQLWRLPR
jgi:dolichol-phosphate mannosyltransferase